MSADKEDVVRIWSFEHDAWWAPDSRGYVGREENAGLYERSEAEKIVHQANYGGELNEAIVEVKQPPLKEQIGALIREINAQDNRCTATPYYYAVQSKKWVPDEWGWGDETKRVILTDDGQLYTLEEWKAEDDGNTEESWEEQNPFEVTAMWEDKAIFLTESAALLYMRANRHRLTEPRTYVKHFWRNSQMELVMKALEEFSGENLKWR